MQAQSRRPSAWGSQGWGPLKPIGATATLERHVHYTLYLHVQVSRACMLPLSEPRQEDKAVIQQTKSREHVSPMQHPTLHFRISALPSIAGSHCRASLHKLIDSTAKPTRSAITGDWTGGGVACALRAAGGCPLWLYRATRRV